MDLFCYGTLADYNSNKGAYLALTPAQLRKLQAVSILRTCAFEKVISYDQLYVVTGLKSDADVVGLLLEVMMGGLLRAKINEKERKVKVLDVVGLGLSSKKIPTLQSIVRGETDRMHSMHEKLTGALDHIATVKYDDEQFRKSILAAK